MRLPFLLPIPKRQLLTCYPLEEKLRTCPTHALKGPTRVRLHDPLANCTGFQPRHLAQALESLAVSTVAVACSLRSSRVHPTLSPTSTPFPFAHRQKIRACSQGGQPQQPTSWAKTFKSPPIGHFSRFLHRAQFLYHQSELLFCRNQEHKG